MSENPLNIPVEVNERGVDELIDKLQQADDLLLKLREDAAKAFSASTGLYSNKAALGGPASAPFSVAQQAASQYRPEQLSSAFGPQFAASMQAVQARQQVLEQSVRTFLQSPSARGLSGTPNLLQAFQTYAGASSAPSAPSSAAQRPVPITASQDFAQQLSRALSVYNRPMQMAAFSMGSRLLGPLGGMSYPLMNAAGAGLAEGGLAAGLGLAGLGVGVVAGAGAALSASQASYQRRQALLLSSAFTTPGAGDPDLTGLDVNAVGQGYNFRPDQANKTAVQLAMAGIPQNQLIGALSNTFAMGRTTGLGPDTIAPLTSALAVQGGLSQDQISKTFQTLIAGAKQTGVAVNRLVQDMSDLARSTGNASVGIAGLAAVQSIVGPAINAGQVMAPVLGASGTTALQAAAMLGITPDQLLSMQSSKTGAAHLWDRIGAVSKRFGRGAQGIDITEKVLQDTGLLDLSNMAPSQAARIVSLLQSGKTGAAQQLASSITSTAAKGMEATPTWWGDMAQATEAQTSATERLTIVLQNWWTGQTNGGAQPPAPPSGQSGHYVQVPTRTGTRWQWVPSPPPTGPAGASATAAGLGAGQSYAFPASMDAAPNRLSTQYLQYYLAASKQSGVPLSILLAQGAQESGFNPTAVNPQGVYVPGVGTEHAEGIAQFLPSTAKQFGINPFNVQQSISAQAKYDAQLYKQYGTWGQALDAYGTGAQILQVAMELSGKLEVVDSSGKVVGTVDVSQATTKIKHPPQSDRAPAGRTSHGPPPGLHRH